MTCLRACRAETDGILGEPPAEKLDREQGFTDFLRMSDRKIRPEVRKKLSPINGTTL
jgi:hypothetical protein